MNEAEPTIAVVLHGLGNTLAADPRDWGLDRRDAWLYGVILGWDCEECPDGQHDDLCDDGEAMRIVAERHQWSEEDVARLRARRAVFKEVAGRG